MIPILCFAFAIVLLMVLFPTKNETINQVLFWLITILLIAIATFKLPGSDRDYRIYKYYWGLHFFSDVEFSFLFIKGFLKNYLQLSLFSLFFVYAVLGVFIKMKAIKMLSTTFFLSILIYISNYYLVHELTQIRAGVAAGLFLVSIRYIYDRNLYAYIGIMAVAGFFHYSAFLALPLWFLKSDRSYLNYYLLLIPLGYVLFFFGIDVIANVPIPYVQARIEAYKAMRDLGIGDKASFTLFRLSYLVKVIVFLILYFYKDVIIRENKYAYLLLRIYAISLLVFPLLAEVPAFSYRVQSLLGVVDVILVPLLLTLFKHRIVGYAIVVLIAAGFFTYNLVFSELIQ